MYRVIPFNDCKDFGSLVLTNSIKTKNKYQKRSKKPYLRSKSTQSLKRLCRQSREKS